MKEILEQMLTVDPSVIKDRIQGLIDILVLQEQNRIVEEIEKELIKVLKVSKTADDYHIGIAYVIDTFLKSANINQPLTK